MTRTKSADPWGKPHDLGAFMSPNRRSERTLPRGSIIICSQGNEKQSIVLEEKESSSAFLMSTGDCSQVELIPNSNGNMHWQGGLADRNQRIVGKKLDLNYAIDAKWPLLVRK